MPRIEANIGKLYAFNFAIGCHFIGSVLIPFFLEWGKISFMQVMILQTWYMIWTFCLEVPTGVVADCLGRKASLVVGCVFFFLAPIIYVAKPEFTVFMAGEFFFALAGSFFSGAGDALLYDSLKEMGQENESKKFIGRWRSLNLAGMITGTLAGSYIAAALGIKWPMLLMAIPAALGFIVALSLKEPLVEEKCPARYFKTMFDGMKYLCSHKILRLLALDAIVAWSLCFCMIWTYQLLLKELNVNLAFYGVVHIVIIGSQILVVRNFSRMEKILRSKKRYLTASTLLPGIAFIGLGFGKNIFFAAFLLAVIAGFGISRLVLMDNYMQKHIASEIRATVLSAVSMVRHVAMSATYLLLGLSVELSLSGTFIGLGALLTGLSLTSRIKEPFLID